MIKPAGLLAYCDEALKEGHRILCGQCNVGFITDRLTNLSERLNLLGTKLQCV